MISASAALTGSYDYAEVARSVFIAIVASYAALDLAGRVTAAKSGIRLAWLSGWRDCDGHRHLGDALHGNAGLPPASARRISLADSSGLAPGGGPRVRSRAVCGEPPENGSLEDVELRAFAIAS